MDVYDGQKSYKFTNDTKGFYALVELMDKESETVFIFEPTGVYSYALSAFCSKHQIGVVTVSPKVSRDFARSLNVRSKTDKIDAKVLYQYQKHIESSMIHIPKINRNAVKIQEMLNSYEAILKSKQRFLNQIEAISKDNKELLSVHHKIIASLDKEAQKLFKKIETLILKDDDSQQRYQAIRSIPAIGQKSALYLMAFFMKYPDANAKEMTALVGLDPVLRESGMFQGRQRISKQGGQQLRNLLYMPTLSALRFNDRIKLFYDKLIQNAKSKKLAVIAAMRKLFLMAFSIFKSNQTYLPLPAVI